MTERKTVATAIQLTLSRIQAALARMGEGRAVFF
jgi:hypothetical protein